MRSGVAKTTPLGIGAISNSRPGLRAGSAPEQAEESLSETPPNRRSGPDPPAAHLEYLALLACQLRARSVC